MLVFAIILLAACAPRQATEGSADNPASTAAGEEQVALPLPAWSEDSDCVSCHVAEVESGGNTACTYSLHTTVECLTCHTDADGKLTTGHAKYDTAKQPTRLKKTTVSSDVCKNASCHDIEEIKTITASLTVLTDSEGTTVNPHDMPTTDQHEKNLNCSNCHKMHKQEPIAETAKAVCIGCHHQNVYQCGTCHD
jgi:hypothetical protein